MNIKDKRLAAIIKISQKAFGRYKWQISVLTVLGFLSGLIEGIGVNALIPLFSFVVGKSSGSDDFITESIESFFVYFGIDFTLKYLLIFIVTLFVFKAMVIIIFNYIRIKIDTDYEARTRNDLFKSFLNAKWSYLLKQKMGHLETVLMVDVLRGSVLLRQISNVIMVITGLLMYSLVAINISFTITVITFILGALLFLVFKPLLYKTRVITSKAAATEKRVAHFVSENVVGLKTVKASHINNQITRIGSKYFDELRRFKISTFLMGSISSSLLQPISLIFIVVVFAIAYKLPNFSFVALIAIVYLIQRIFQYIQQLQTNLHSISDAIPYLKTVLDYQEKSQENRERITGSDRFSFKKELRFKDVCFSYDDDRKVIDRLNFSIKKGEMVGLIGGSGAGKTTIVDLMLRLFETKSGSIELDDKDINNISIKDWRKNIGYVSQDIFLVNDTIANNIRFYDSSISDDDVIKAAKMANIYDFIQSCPEKLSTMVGDRGVMVSAGQRQRIVIARVLARKPQLLILDEATSALDNESEAKIQKVIDNLHGKTTVLVIAHRLTTVMGVDKLAVLEKGKIVEEGSPEDLLKDNASYFYKLNNIGK